MVVFPDGYIYGGSSLIFTGNSVSGNLCYDLNGRYSPNPVVQAGSESFTVTNNIFNSNVGQGTLSSFNPSSTGIIVANSFINNSATSYGNLACLNGASITVGKNVFANNGGSAIYIDGSTDTAIITGNTFSGNSGSLGGGIAAYGSTLVVTNNSFVGNSGTTGGAVYSTSITTTCIGNIIRGNSGPGRAFYANGATVSFVDNLVANNTGGGTAINVTSSLNYINNTVTGNTSAGNGGEQPFRLMAWWKHCMSTTTSCGAIRQRVAVETSISRAPVPRKSFNTTMSIPCPVFGTTRPITSTRPPPFSTQPMGIITSRPGLLASILGLTPHLDYPRSIWTLAPGLSE